MIKNALYLILKALFLFKIFQFLSCNFGHFGLVRKDIINSKVQNLVNKQLQLCNISQNKGNQAMKFGQALVYNKINLFIKESCRK